LKKSEEELQERCLKAFLDKAILAMLGSKSMSGYAITLSFAKKLGIIINPSIVYSKLTLMEREGLVSCAQSRRGRVYKTTDSGKKSLENTINSVDRVYGIIEKLLNSH